MTQEPESIPQAAPPSRVTPSFTVIVEKQDFVSWESKSKTITGTLGNGKPTHVFKIMANKTFPGSLSHAKSPTPEDTGMVMLMVHKLKEDGTPGTLVLGWEKSAAASPVTDTPETAEIKAAMMWDIFTEFGYNPSEPLPEKKPQVTEENAEPAAKL